jgi:hypothetical protein
VQQQGDWGRGKRLGRPGAGGRNRRAWDWRIARLPGVEPVRWERCEGDPEPAPDFHSGVQDFHSEVSDLDFLRGEGLDFHSEDSEPFEGGE